MNKLLPLLLILVGLGAGVGAGLALRPPAPDLPDGAESAQKVKPPEDTHELTDAELLEQGADAFVKINNQFVVPVLDESRVRALVVLSISLKVEELSTERVFKREPMLRDAFLQVLFEHAHIGGFDGIYTQPELMVNLKRALLRRAKSVAGPDIQRVLITDIVRQDL